MTATTLLILSDSHGHPDRITEAIRRVRPDGILFAGDGLRDFSYCDLPCPLWAVRGNCDWMRSPLIIGGASFQPSEEEIVTVEGVRILLTHGHTQGVKGGLGGIITHGIRNQADVVIFGHTHIPVEHRLAPDHEGSSGSFTVSKPLTLFNPGSIGDYTPSFGTLTIRGGQMLFGHGEL